jgi:hypothetical protein
MVPSWPYVQQQSTRSGRVANSLVLKLEDVQGGGVKTYRRSAPALTVTGWGHAVSREPWLARLYHSQPLDGAWGQSRRTGHPANVQSEGVNWMTMAIPSTGRDLRGAARRGGPGRVDYLLAAVPSIGWRIVNATAAERALLEAHGFGSGRVQ